MRKTNIKYPFGYLKTKVKYDQFLQGSQGHHEPAVLSGSDVDDIGSQNIFKQQAQYDSKSAGQKSGEVYINQDATVTMK